MFDRRRRQALTALAGVAAGTTAAPAVLAKPSFRWRMVTSWPKHSPGPGTTAEALAKRIEHLSDGRLAVQVFGAGELVPALEVFDAVAGGAAEMGHSAAFFWQGKLPASAFFTAVPFGMTPGEHEAWIYHGGGQALWDELYGDFGLKPFLAGNTGPSMAGWFKRTIQGLEDVAGLKVRIPGLGGEAWRRLGAVPVVVAPGEIFSALESGVVDGAEFLGPWSDLSFGLYRTAPHYYWPGFHEPNGSGECLVRRQSFEALPLELREVVATACMAENNRALGESRWHNARALQTLVDDHGVELKALPAEVLGALRRTSADVLAEFEDKDPLSRRVYRAYQRALERSMPWSERAIGALLNARRGD
ncbi:MAG: TRAP transporter substrate-binding protein [Candidatus Competibacterales bacterium]